MTISAVVGLLREEHGEAKAGEPIAVSFRGPSLLSYCAQVLGAIIRGRYPSPAGADRLAPRTRREYRSVATFLSGLHSGEFADIVLADRRLPRIGPSPPSSISAAGIAATRLAGSLCVGAWMTLIAVP